MIYVYFIFAASITLWAAVKLSNYADQLSRYTNWGGMFIGSILLAGATSLPEVTTSFSAISIDNPDMAIASLLGSNLFNLLILATLDVYFRRSQMFAIADQKQIYTALLGICLTLIIAGSFMLHIPYAVWGIGLDTLLLFTIYGSGMFMISRINQQEYMMEHQQGKIMHHQQKAEQTIQQDGRKEEKTEERTERQPDSQMTSIFFLFALSAIIIFISASLLTFLGDEIAHITGLGSSFVGLFLIAATTSLPEIVTCYIAFRFKNYSLVIGNILGSNLFNMLILMGTDIIYRPGPLLYAGEQIHLFTTILILVLSGIVLYNLRRKNVANSFLYALPSALVIILYFLSSYVLFILFY